MSGLEPEASLRPESGALQDHVARLPLKHRAILFQKYRLGLNATEIAERLGLSAADVRTSLHRVLKVLRRNLVR